MGKTILVADDSRTIRRVVELTFMTTGFKVVSVADAAEAMARLPEIRPDVVLADVGMPGKDGYELCAAIKASPATRNIPVLLLTGAFDGFDEGRAQKAAANGHIKKPFESQALISMVNDAFGLVPDRDEPQTFAATLAKRSEPPRPAPPPPAPPASSPHAVSPMAARGAPNVADLGMPAPSNRPFAAPPPPSPPPPRPAPSAGPTLGGAYPSFQAKGAAKPSDVLIEEPDDVIEDDEVMEDDGVAGGPTLEPPTPPSEPRARPNVDVWALADSVPASAAKRNAMIEAIEVDEVPHGDHHHGPTADLRQTPAVAKVARGLADKAAGPIAAAAGMMVPGMNADQLLAVARDVIEKIAWEVVPDLAEVIIRAEIERLMSEE